MFMKKDGFKNERYVSLPIKNFPEHLNHPLIDHNYITELGFYPTAKYHYRERGQGINEFLLIYCIAGKGMIEINHQSTAMNTGKIFCIPQKKPHRYFSDSKEPWSILWMHFSLADAALFPVADRTPVIIKSPEKSSLIQNHFIELFQLGEQEYSLNNFICISQLMRALLAEVFFLKDGRSYDKQNQMLNKAITYMAHHIADDLSLNQIADQLTISPSYLSAVFKAYTQKAPMTYFSDLKMEQACKYLRMSELKNYEIAQKIGYKDPYYFSRAFKKKMKVSPKEYRYNLTKNLPAELQNP